jgi:hypothetical protein
MFCPSFRGPSHDRSGRSLCFALAIALFNIGLIAAAAAQDTQPPAPPTTESVEQPLANHTVGESASASVAPADCCLMPDGTVLELEIAEALSSKTAQRGQRFKLRLAAPLSVGDVLLLPVGTEGYGEVVHADRARMAGKPGELLLTGRALNGPNGEIKLRGFRLGGSGENRANAAYWIPLGFLIQGGQIEIPAGARAHAKIAGAQRIVSLPPSPEIAAPPIAAPPSSDPTQAATPADNDTDAQPPQPR